MELKVFTANNDLSRRWCVKFSWFNHLTGKSHVKKVYGYINRHKDLKSRLEAVEQLKKEIKKKLEEGWQPSTRLRRNDYAVKYAHSPANSKLAAGTFEYILNVYLSEISISSSKKTTQSRQSKFRIFIEFLKEKKLEKIKPCNFDKDLAFEFVRWLMTVRKIQDTTKDDYISYLRRFFEFLKKNRLTRVNPFLEIPKSNASCQGKLPFQKHQIVLLKNKIQIENPELWLVIQLIFYCFIRPGEIRKLKIRDIDIDEARILVNKKISKNREGQWVTIPAPLLESLQKMDIYSYKLDYYLFGNKGEPGPEPYGVNYFSKKQREILKDLGLFGDYSLYSWKSTGAVMAVKSGINIKEVKEQLRHSSLEYTDMYLKKAGFVDMTQIKNQFPVL